MVKRVLEGGWTVRDAAESIGISTRRAYRWLARFKAEGSDGLRDRSSQPHRLTRSHELGLVVEAVGRRRRGQAAIRIANELGVPRSTVGFWLRKAGISRVSDLMEKEPPNRYEQDAPGDLLHLDTKKLANFHQAGHRAIGIRHAKNPKAGYQVLHVCNENHSRACYMEVLPDEKKGTTAAFLQRALLHFQNQGITARKLLTDNGSPYRSKEFKASPPACIPTAASGRPEGDTRSSAPGLLPAVPSAGHAESGLPGSPGWRAGAISSPHQLPGSLVLPYAIR
ncbi:MAG: helix-turn-helix domain-containing protein [Holophagaceae bacterium]|uniref:Helix-turn-helix domain-containing protein n=1 Tax=Candidatus Geothrix odensensis TaxID=2954440 RepID=A0A936F433_9BACT|nr:helix-turn-helix domain-containing protein [Candidatus Geothrix odensensis]